MGGEHWSVSGSGNGESLLSLLIGNCLCLQVFISFQRSLLFLICYIFMRIGLIVVQCIEIWSFMLLMLRRKKKSHSIIGILF